MVSSTSKPSSQQLLCLACESCNMSTARRFAAAMVVLCCTATPISAQTKDVMQFFAGAALGRGLHDWGHLVLDEGFGAQPGVRKVSAGFIPFFAITHEPVSPLKEFTISSAGFWVQHAGSALLLMRRPVRRRVQRLRVDGGGCGAASAGPRSRRCHQYARAGDSARDRCP